MFNLVISTSKSIFFSSVSMILVDVLQTGSCLINGYCFSEGGKNPWNPNCQECDSAADNSKWKTLPGLILNKYQYYLL